MHVEGGFEGPWAHGDVWEKYRGVYRRVIGRVCWYHFWIEWCPIEWSLVVVTPKKKTFHQAFHRKWEMMKAPCILLAPFYHVIVWTHYDKDITPSNTHNNNNPPSVIQGPITRVRAWQLNLELSSFLYSPLYDFENRLLSNDYIMIRYNGEDKETLTEGLRAVEDQ